MPPSRSRVVLGVVLVWALILAAATAAAEWYLRWRYLSIAGSDRLQAGMSIPDPTLGWRLNPSWRGTHAHHDFDARYSINAGGFRGLDARNRSPAARNIALVGDSFTFGIGVNDDETFASLLNRSQPGSRRFYNFSVPGYSTDQEVLLAEQQVFARKPDVLVLVVYLANDLFDNQLTMPLQVRRAKPRFQLQNDELVLTNSPVPNGPMDRAGQPTLLDMVLGNRPDDARLRQRLEGRSYLFRLLSETILPAPTADPEFDQRFAPALRLFWALIDRLQGGCAAAGTRCAIALMGGRSFVEAPSSLSAQFQDYFRRRIGGAAAGHHMDVIDIGAELKRRFERQPGQWFHPNEGHLDADGHRIVANIFADALTAFETSSSPW